MKEVQLALDPTGNVTATQLRLFQPFMAFIKRVLS